MAVRAAIGASRWRIMLQLMIESLTLAAIGCAGGLVIAWFGVEQLQAQIVERMNTPGWFEFRLDHRVVLFAMGTMVLAGLIAGLFPAWQTARLDVNTALKDESRGASSLSIGRFSRWIVTAQIAFASALLVAGCSSSGTSARPGPTSSRCSG